MSTEIPKKLGMKRWLRVVLVLSLTMNLVVIGLIGGAALRFGKSGPPHMSGPDGLPIISALDRADRRDIGKSIRKASRALGDRAARAEKDKAHYQRIADMIEADPVDTDALRAAGAALDDRMSQRRQIAQDAWINKVAGMNLEDRKSYAARLRDILDNPKEWRKKSVRKDH
ncbi:periplasmic heavy metal sensor [Shimia sediminis]|uniref:periplasmic heavy metal sensor n=1 Tax=Shimia sediminis TaxID=2497945 RepID=UPI000F8C8148|nr:periplasmic heavy metal sensor [Shimia sediminis]